MNYNVLQNNKFELITQVDIQVGQDNNNNNNNEKATKAGMSLRHLL
jgi:hypothetical protein